MKKYSGMSLVEMMAVLIIVGIIAAIAIPNMGDFLRNGRIRTASNDLLIALMLARSEAAKNNRPASVSGVSRSAADNWGGGWSVWVDFNENRTRDAGEDVRLFEPVDGTVAMREVNGVQEVRFLRSGMRRVGSNVISISICDNRTGETGRTVTVNGLGRTEVDLLTC